VKRYKYIFHDVFIFYHLFRSMSRHSEKFIIFDNEDVSFPFSGNRKSPSGDEDSANTFVFIT